MRKNRVLGVLISFALMLTMMPVLSQTVYADAINYIDEDGVVQSCTEYTPISTGSDYTWSNGWYFATGAIINERITVSGVVNVILCDGTDLYANKGITVENGSTLNIYAQSTGDSAGQLVSEVPEGNNLEYYAGIGGELSGAIGNVTINGGKITARGGEQAAGIGGGSSEANVGTVTINGGSVEAYGKRGGAGIGGGNGSSGVIVTINGGSVIAKGHSGGAGIGGGNGKSGGTVTINGGSVTAIGDGYAGGVESGGAGIGGGQNGSGGAVTICDGSITATGGTEAAGIGGGKKGAGGTVEIKGGSVTAACGDSGRAAIGSGKGSSAGGTVTIGEGVTVKAGDSESDSSYIKASTFEEAHNHYKWAHTSVTPYPLWVGGTQVTSSNASNITGGDTVTASYTPATDTSAAVLKLNEYDNEGRVGEKTAGIYAEENLIIETAGTNTVTSTEVYACAIQVTEDLTFKGSGTLYATSNGVASAIGALGTVTINGGAVSATSVGSSISVMEGLNIIGGTVYVSSSGTNASGIYSQNGNIIISGGSVTASATGYKGTGIQGKNDIEITGGTVTAKGTDTNESYGIKVNQSKEVTISGGVVKAEGCTKAIDGIVKNSIKGTGWTNVKGTEGKAAIETSNIGQDLSYKKVQFPEAVDPAPADTTPVGSVHNVNGSNYIVSSAGTVSLVKAPSRKSFTLPATVVIDGKTFSVTGIYAQAFKGTKEKTLIVKTKGLTKASVKGSLKGSKIKTVKVKVGKKKENKKYVKKYKKIFTKKNAGKKAKVSL